MIQCIAIPADGLFSDFEAAPVSTLFAGPVDRRLVQNYQATIETRVNPRLITLVPGELLVTTLRGFQMVVPGWNMDVAPGIIRDGLIEPWTNEVLLSVLHEGDQFVNIGANFGYYSLLGAQRVGRSGAVYAVEANPYVFPFLVKSAYWGGYPDVIRMFNAAAAAPEQHRTKVSFLFDPQFIGGGTLTPGSDCAGRPFADTFWNAANITETLNDNRQFTPRWVNCKIETECRTVDSMVPVTAEIKVMLIDAEGSECHVIAGAKETIRRSPHISLIVEWSPHVLRDEVKRLSADAMWRFLLEEMDLQAYRICPENYPGLGAMPRLEPLTREQLNHVPHSDIFLRPS